MAPVYDFGNLSDDDIVYLLREGLTPEQIEAYAHGATVCLFYGWEYSGDGLL